MNPRSLTDDVLERALRDAIQARDEQRTSALRAEAWRRYAGQLGLPDYLMGESHDNA